MSWEEQIAKATGALGIIGGAVYTVVRLLRRQRSDDHATTIQDRLLEQLSKSAEALQQENDALRARLDEQDRALQGLRAQIATMQDELWHTRARAARAEALLRQHNIPLPGSPAAGGEGPA